MPGKLIKKILEEFRENDDTAISLVDQGISNILDIPEICKKNFEDLINLLLDTIFFKLKYLLISLQDSHYHITS
jgi:hypothetical protein